MKMRLLIAASAAFLLLGSYASAEEGQFKWRDCGDGTTAPDLGDDYPNLCGGDFGDGSSLPQPVQRMTVLDYINNWAEAHCAEYRNNRALRAIKSVEVRTPFGGITIDIAEACKE